MKQPPWHRDPLNWTLLVAIASLMIIAYTFAPKPGGGHDPVPFPREKHIIPWRDEQ